MRTMFDASALYKRYAVEPGSEAVMRLCARARQVLVAPHCYTEVAAAFSRHLHDRLISADQWTDTLARVAADFEEFAVVGLTSEVEQGAIAAMGMARLRAMDALHVGAAQVARAELFVTADRQQAEAARALGLKTEWIEA